jgi:FkbM family methyltransferase
MKLYKYLQNLIRWIELTKDVNSIIKIGKIRRCVRRSRNYGLDSAVPVKVDGLDFPIYIRKFTNDYIVFREMFVSHGAGEYSDFLDGIQGPVDYILDVGSNAGYSIAYFLREWPRAKVTGIEPFDPNVQLAEQSFARLIEKGQVRLHQCFAGSGSGYAPLVPGESGGSNTFSKGDRESSEVLDDCPVRPISDILATDHPEGPIDVMKCDVEGGEAEIFDNCAAWIDRVRHIVVEVHGGLDKTWLQSRISENGARLDVRGHRKGHGSAELIWGKIR